MRAGDFESHFRTVVLRVGGELIPESESLTADFLFAKENIIAELKTFQEDARQDHAIKLQQLVDDWIKRRLLIAYGRPRISLQHLNPVCQKEWLKVLQAPVQEIVRKANRQIRTTKQSLSRADAKGLLVVANDGNFLQTSPTDYMILVSRVLQKKTQSGERQYPHISGVVYFSFRVPSRDEGLPFWVNGDINGDTEIRGLQLKLKRGWFSYLGQITGRPVTELLMPTPQ